jgi:hypothetical protein
MNLTYIDSLVKSIFLNNDYINIHQSMDHIQFDSIDLFKFFLKSNKNSEMIAFEKLPLNEINQMLEWLHMMEKNFEPSFSILKSMFFLSISDKSSCLESIRNGVRWIAHITRPCVFLNGGVKAALGFDSAIDGVISLIFTLINSDYTPIGNVRNCLTSFSYVGCSFEYMIGTLFDFGDLDLNDILVNDQSNSRHLSLIEPLKEFLSSIMKTSIYLGLGNKEAGIKSFSTTLAGLNSLIINFSQLFFDGFENISDVEKSLDVINYILNSKLDSLINGRLTPYLIEKNSQSYDLMFTVFKKFKFNNNQIVKINDIILKENEKLNITDCSNLAYTILDVDDKTKCIQNDISSNNNKSYLNSKYETRMSIQGFFILFFNMFTFILVLMIIIFLFKD